MRQILPLLSAAAICTTTAPAQSIDYTRQVHAVFAARCIVCHSSEKRSGGLSLATYQDVLNGGRNGAAVKPGNSSGSLIVSRLTASGPSRMPLGGPALSPTDLATITKWIDEGARSAPNAAPAKPRWEPTLSLAAPTPPTATWPTWSAPLDRFTARYLASHGTGSSPTLVSDAVFARRAWLDIQGLLPPPEELRAFLADRDPDKRTALVTRLLADDRKYAEHWISYWNDLLRNDEGVTYYSETAGRKSITDWLLHSLLANRPYNEWVAKLLNPTGPNDPEGFLIGVNWRGTVSASQTPALQAAQNTAQIFLGVNLKCNSCHDSFISKWKLKDAYQLAAFFSSEERLRLYRCDVSQDEYAQAGFLYPELNRPLADMSPEERRATAAAIFTDPRNGRMPRTVVNRIWQRLMGRGIVADVDEMDGEPWDPALLDFLAADFVAHGYDLKYLIATIIESRTYQLPAVAHRGEPESEYVFRGPELRRLSAEQFSDAVASITGDWHAIPGRVPSPAPLPRSGPLVILGGPIDGANIARPTPPALTPPATAPPIPVPIPPGTYVRGWRIPGSPLERALGRPIRDQVYSTRDTQATTIQALELVNGEALTHWLWRGARRMLGELPDEPVSLVARQANAGKVPPIPFDIDISHSERLYLIVQDSLSTAPDKAAPLWVQPELEGPNGIIPLSALQPLDRAGLREDNSPVRIAGLRDSQPPALRVKLSSVLVYDIAGKGFTRFRAAPGHEDVPLIQGESVNTRFYVFDREPAMDRLVPPKPETPIPAEPTLTTVPATVDRVYWYTLGREASAAERRIAESALRTPSNPAKPSPEGLADLLWSLMMTPEFQFIR